MMIRENLDRIKENIEKICLSSDRDKEKVKLIAVSKNKSKEDIREAYKAGQRDFGENYAQEAEKKVEALKDLDINWHFIGHLQRNKAKFVVNFSYLIHSVDSLALAREIDKQAKKKEKIQDILLQIHLGEEESKSGFNSEDFFLNLNELASLEHIRIRGLMSLPPPATKDDNNQIYFQTLAKLMEKANQKKILKEDLSILSMGMSDDYEAAIKEGANYIRIGTAIFGARERL